jgi:hypothetical protein
MNTAAPKMKVHGVEEDQVPTNDLPPANSKTTIQKTRTPGRKNMP